MIKIKRNRYTFLVDKKENSSHFYIQKGEELIDTHFLVHNDDKYITLFDDRKKKHEYITYAMKVNKYRMLDNIIERYERNRKKEKASEAMRKFRSERK